MESTVLTAAGIITYNPDINLLKKSIGTIVKQVNYIVIVDNCSSNKANIEELQQLSNTIHIIFNESNNGVAVALNQIGNYAEQLGCQWFLTLDQDSVCPPNLISEYSNYINISDIGLLCPLISQRIGQVAQSNGNAYQYIKLAITSGSLVRTNAWKCVNGFWNELFIDKVDDDFCFALRDNGWKILQINSVALEHQIGNPSLHTLFGIKYYTDSYPPFRYYYIARNTQIVCHYYKDLPYNKNHLIFKKSLKILFGEDKKCSKILAFLRGLIEGRKLVKSGLCRNKI